jgi:hypothetical protein
MAPGVAYGSACDGARRLANCGKQRQPRVLGARTQLPVGTSAASWRRRCTEAKTTGGHLGEEMGAARHAADRYRAQVRALHPPHRHLESPPRPPGRAPAHARPRAGPAPVTARNDACREGGVCRQFVVRARPRCQPVAARCGVFVCSRHRPAAVAGRVYDGGTCKHRRTPGSRRGPTRQNTEG